MGVGFGLGSDAGGPVLGAGVVGSGVGWSSGGALVREGSGTWGVVTELALAVVTRGTRPGCCPRRSHVARCRDSHPAPRRRTNGLRGGRSGRRTSGGEARTFIGRRCRCRAGIHSATAARATGVRASGGGLRGAGCCARPLRCSGRARQEPRPPVGSHERPDRCPGLRSVLTQVRNGIRTSTWPSGTGGTASRAPTSPPARTKRRPGRPPGRRRRADLPRTSTQPPPTADRRRDSPPARTHGRNAASNSPGRPPSRHRRTDQGRGLPPAASHKRNGALPST